MNAAPLIAVILLAPLAASVTLLLFGRRLPRQGDFLAVGAIAVAWIASMILFRGTFLAGVESAGVTWEWLVSGGMSWRLGFRPDYLATSMLLVVPGVSLLVHVYAVGYMHGHDRYGRFFAYISFFTFAMLVLVLADNFFFFFVAWELMGLCSYLLIGFYFEEEAPQKAQMKAFLTTRVGDVGLFLGIAVLFAYTGQLTFTGVAHAVREGAFAGHEGMLLLASLFVLSGAVGKSAQFPLHVWLPDAMEGPSPVSALIHAATMVAAGIFLIARSAVFFPAGAMTATALVGSFTAFFAATMALVNRDFKKIMAFSTISQLGYMLAAIGLGSTFAGMLHLTTHAYFKALLFLGSGAVLHAVHSRSLDDMGGLRTKMPITYVTMMIGSLSLAGFPFLTSGFYSKDEILAQALYYGETHGRLGLAPFCLLTAAAALTAFYTFRMMILAFHGTPRNRHKWEHAHEAPASMWAPLAVLALLSFFFVPRILTGSMNFAQRIGAPVHNAEIFAHAHHTAMYVSIAAGLGGIALAFAMYHFRAIPADALIRNPVGKEIHRVLLDLYGIDAFYMAGVRRTIALAKHLGAIDRKVIDFLVDMWGPIGVWKARRVDWIDRNVVDFLVNALADVAQGFGRVARTAMTGRMQDQVFGWAVGVAALVWVAVHWTFW